MEADAAIAAGRDGDGDADIWNDRADTFASIANYMKAYGWQPGHAWGREVKLPAGGQATPMTYALDNGKQYVVMVAGGHGSVGTKPGDYVIAYTLPD